MGLNQLDYFFPFFVFFYGILLTFVIESPFLAGIRSGRGSALYSQLNQHRGLAWICLFVGGIWSLQNLIFG